MIISTFEQFLHQYNVLYPGQTILLAVSGGVDSIVLFHLMEKVIEKNDVKLVVAHVNHQLRPEADAEERFVRKLASSHQVPFSVFRWNKKDHPNSGIEEAARHIRYDFFKQVMDENEANVLMTGHHQDDQVETVLMKLTRGSTLKQLTGIEPRQNFNDGELIRPLLPFAKKELYSFAHKHQLEYVEDETNRALDYSRNRFRNQIIPLLKEENKQLNNHLEQFIKDLTDVIDISKQPIQQAYDKLISVKNQTFTFNYKDFLDYEAAMQRAILQKVLENVYAHEKASYKTNYIELIREWLSTGAVNTHLDLLGNVTVKKNYKKVVLSKETKKGPKKIKDEKHSIQEINQCLQLSPTETLSLVEYTDEEISENHLILQADELSLPLTVRHRQPGDRMTYAGLSGSKKIKDIFIDEKTPLDQRDKAWLVEDADGRIIWLISFRQMNLLSDLETDRLTYILKYKNLNLKDK